MDVTAGSTTDAAGRDVVNRGRGGSVSAIREDVRENRVAAGHRLAHGQRGGHGTPGGEMDREGRTGGFRRWWRWDARLGQRWLRERRRPVEHKDDPTERDRHEHPRADARGPRTRTW